MLMRGRHGAVDVPQETGSSLVRGGRGDASQWGSGGYALSFGKLLREENVAAPCDALLDGNSCEIERDFRVDYGSCIFVASASDVVRDFGWIMDHEICVAYRGTP